MTRRPSPSAERTRRASPDLLCLEPQRIERCGVERWLVAQDERRHLLRARGPEDHAFRAVTRRDEQPVARPVRCIGRSSGDTGRTPDHVASIGASASAGTSRDACGGDGPRDLEVVGVGRRTTAPARSRSGRAVGRGLDHRRRRRGVSCRLPELAHREPRAVRVRSPCRRPDRPAVDGLRSGSSAGTAADRGRVHEPAARRRDRQRDADRTGRARPTTARGQHHDVRLDDAVVGHDARDPSVAFDEPPRGRVVTDGRSLGPGERAEAHGEGQRVDPMPSCRR